MNRILLIFFLLSFSLFSQQKPVVVLELFTSQGCSSCPSADDALYRIKEKLDPETVIPIAYHVDYWNYIGWKDPFSKKSFTDKQRYYGQKFRSNSIYTPQLVINGNEHLVGSNEVTIHKKIKQYLKRKASNSISLSNVKKEDNSISFNYSIQGDIKDKYLEAILIINDRKTKVKRGENRNRTLYNSNIAVSEKVIFLTDKNSGALNITIPEVVVNDDTLRLTVIIKDQNLSVTGGTQIAL